MKRFLWIFIFLILFVPFHVFAEENILSLIESGDKIYYDEKHFALEEPLLKIFPEKNKTYQVSFEVRNTSRKKIDLNFTMESMAQDGSYNDTLEYFHLKVTRGKKVIYDGSTGVIDYTSKDQELHDFIPLGKIDPKGDATYQLEFTLSDEYTEVSDSDFAYLYGTFYEKGKKEYTEILKITPEVYYSSYSTWILVGICILTAILVLSIVLYRMRHKYKKEDEEEGKKKKRFFFGRKKKEEIEETKEEEK